jgi:hypothetical protein
MFHFSLQLAQDQHAQNNTMTNKQVVVLYNKQKHKIQVTQLQRLKQQVT